MKNKLNKNFWNKHGHVVIIYVFLVALMLLVSVFSRDFFTIGNFKNLLRTSFPLFEGSIRTDTDHFNRWY